MELPMKIHLNRFMLSHILDLFSDLLQNIYANNVKIDSTDVATANSQSAVPKVTALISMIINQIVFVL